MTVASRGLLARVLEEGDLVTAVRALEPSELGALIKHVGLEDAGEIVELATSEQLARVMDEDVWTSHRPGEDEVFDGARFAVWLEVLLESGDDVVADKLVDLPEELVVLGLHRQVLVLDMDVLVTDTSRMGKREAEQLDKALDGCLAEEIGQFRVISRRHEGWDAVLSVLLALDKNHHDFACRVLDRLCNASSDLIEDNGGLCEALSCAEMIAEDASADREDRRAAEGFVAPSAAKSFLALALASSAKEVLAEKQRDPVTRAHFRELDRAAIAERDVERARPLLTILRDTEVASRRALPATIEDEPPFRTAMRELATRDPATYTRRLEELAYLVNVLIVGESHEGRAYRPYEAAQVVVEACNRGLLRASQNDAKDAEEVLARLSADQLFRIGFGD